MQRVEHRANSRFRGAGRSVTQGSRTRSAATINQAGGVVAGFLVADVPTDLMTCGAKPPRTAIGPRGLYRAEADKALFGRYWLRPVFSFMAFGPPLAVIGPGTFSAPRARFAAPTGEVGEGLHQRAARAIASPGRGEGLVQLTDVLPSHGSNTAPVVTALPKVVLGVASVSGSEVLRWLKQG